MSIKPLLLSARKNVRLLGSLSEEKVNEVLVAVADALVMATTEILEANARDLEKMDASDYRYDRLRLTGERIASIATDMRNVALLPTPRKVLEQRTLPNGLFLEKVAVPFGVIGVIFEARPNVSADVFSLCFKSGNVCILKGGHDAEESNRAITTVIRKTLEAAGIGADAVVLLPSTREATDELLEARGMVDLLIPRGSKRLIDTVRQCAKVPVIETGAGVCHCYVHSSADLPMATAIVNNAKTRRVSVCNALDCVIIDRDIVSALPGICAPLADASVVIHADTEAYAMLNSCYPATLLRRAADDIYGTEFLGYEMAVKTVTDIEEALSHIEVNGSGHSESIVALDKNATDTFRNAVDAACVYVNAPTSFTDGAQFGLGAEIGISTQKLHARGPMALRELMTYKWLITGNGQTRP